jgi:hypothetical protein
LSGPTVTVNHSGDLTVDCHVADVSGSSTTSALIVGYGSFNYDQDDSTRGTTTACDGDSSLVLHVSSGETADLVFAAACAQPLVLEPFHWLNVAGSPSGGYFAPPIKTAPCTISTLSVTPLSTHTILTYVSVTTYESTDPNDTSCYDQTPYTVTTTTTADIDMTGGP